MRKWSRGLRIELTERQPFIKEKMVVFLVG